jgi:hypothetical protein
LRRNPATLLIALAAIFVVSIPLLAHHGNAAYDISNPVSVKGTVTSFQFTNPHVMIFLESKNDKGQVEKWEGELTSPNHLSRAGWTHNSLKAGDQVTLIGARAKSGTRALWLTKVIGPDGQPMNTFEGD